MIIENKNGYKYNLNITPETTVLIINKIVEWMKDHSSSFLGGEGIFQDDDCLIDSSELIADIIDNYLEPKLIENES